MFSPARLLAQTSSAQNVGPLISNTPLALIQAEQKTALRASLKPFADDMLSSGTKSVVDDLVKVAEDAPVPATASQVSSFEQTTDLTLSADGPLSATTGVPTGPTPYYTDVTWSHTGNYIIFSAIQPGSNNYHLYAMLASGASIAANGATIQQLTFGTNNERYPSLEGPNDTQIAYCSDNNGAGAFELVTAPFGVVNGVLTIDQADAQSIAPSLEARHPFDDGQAIYFSGRPIADAGTGTPGTAGAVPYDIYSVNGGIITQITGGGSDNDNPVETSAGGGYLAWDSNATGFTYSSTQNNDYYLNANSEGAYRNIYVSTLAGASVQAGGSYALTTAGAYNNDHPQWTTDVSPNSLVTTINSRDLFFDSNRPDLTASGISTLWGIPSSDGTYHLYYFAAIQNNALAQNGAPEIVQESATNPSTEVDTSDPSGYQPGVTPGGESNQFSDVQPAVSQLDSAYVAVAYISNRYLIDHNYDNPLISSTLTAGVTTNQTANSEVALNIATTLSNAADAGADVIDVNSITDGGTTNVFYPGQTIFIDQGNVNFETAVVLSVGTNPTSITLTAPLANNHLAGATVIAASTFTTAATVAGATTLPVASVEGFGQWGALEGGIPQPGQTIEIDRGLATDEFAIITAINATSFTVSKLAYAHMAGAQVDPTVDQEPASIPVNVENPPGAASEVFISRLMDINQPSLVNYGETTGEIVHVFQGTLYGPNGTTNFKPSATPSQYVPAGQSATFIVRLSSRQSGLGQAWLQIKDPNSFTQDATSIEHKVYTQEPPVDFYDANPFASEHQFRSAYNEATTLWNFYPEPSKLNYGNWGLDGYDAAIGGDDGDGIELGSEVAVDLAADGAAPGALGNPTHALMTAAAAPGAMTLTIATGSNLEAGETIEIGKSVGDQYIAADAPFYGAEIDTITAINANKTVITLGTPTQLQHPAGSKVRLAFLGTTTANSIPPAGQGLPQWNVQTPGPDGTGDLRVGEIVAFSNGGIVGDEAEVVQVNSGTNFTVEESQTAEPFDQNVNIGIHNNGYANGIPVYIVATGDFDPLGHEVDCEAINTSLQANNPATGQDLVSSSPTSYSIPTYAPGIDDTLPFGDAMQQPNAVSLGEIPSPTPNGPVSWLRLNPLPANLQDDNGGVLYYGTWNTPSTGSDYYIDVITEDGSTNENWEIYDNVWGFNTVPFQQKNSILVVNDFALPEKFYYWQSLRTTAATPSAQPYTVFGAESYWTDINNDVSDWQNYYAQDPTVQATPAESGLGANLLLPEVAEEYIPGIGLAYRSKLCYGYDPADGGAVTQYWPAYANGLGINTYYDHDMSQVTAVPSGNFTTQLSNSQKYDIWRILSRGPVPLTTLNSYGATTITQPADPLNNPQSGKTQPAEAITVAPDCVIWLSPYAGETESIPGTIVDANTQANLETFLNAGGRLHIEGKSIGYALTQDGAVSNTFYNTYLNDYTVASGTNAYGVDDLGNGAGVFTLAASGGQTDYISRDAFPNGLHAFWYPAGPNAGEEYISPNNHIVDVSHLNSNNPVSDGALDTNGYAGFSFIDAFQTNGQVEFKGTDPDNGFTDQEEFYYGANGSIVSYSSVGIGELSQDVAVNLGGPCPSYWVANERTNIIHNIICTLRTGTITGQVTSTGTTQGLPGVVVDAFLTGVNASQTYTAVTNSAGSFELQGVTAGEYTLRAYLQGYTFQNTGSSGTDVHGGDQATVNLTVTPAPNGSLAVTVEYNPSGTGTPTLIQGATVTLIPVTTATGTTGSGISPVVPSPVQTNAEGVATFPSVQVGSYYINVTAPGYGAVTTTVATVVPTSPEATATVNLSQAPAIIAGTVTAVGSTNTAVSGATVTLVDSTGTPIQIGGASVTTTTSSSGAYTISFDPSSLPAGTTTVYVQVTDAGYAPVSPQPTGGITPVGGDTYTVNVQLLVSASLTVNVINSITGQGVSGVGVEITGAEDLGPDTTGSGGGVTFPATTGTYTVTALSSTYIPLGYTSASTPPSVTINGTNPVTVTILLTPSVGSVSGTVTDALTGSPIVGATVTLTSTSDTSLAPYTATTGSQGTYSIPNVQTGTYTEKVTATNYATGTQTGLVVLTSPPLTENFQLTVNSIHTFSPGLQMISAPYDYTGIPLQDVLEGEIDATQNNAPNIIAAWLPADNAYVKSPTAPCDTLHIGQGYWARFGAGGGYLITAGTTPVGNTEVLLQPGWNMIGVPLPTGVALTSLGFYDSRGDGNPNQNNAPYTFAEASSTAGIDIVNPTIYTYDQGTNSYVAATTLNAYSGYWIEAYTTCTLVF